MNSSIRFGQFFAVLLIVIILPYLFLSPLPWFTNPEPDLLQKKMLLIASGAILTCLFFFIMQLRPINQPRRSLFYDELTVEPRTMSSLSHFICTLAGVDSLILERKYPYEISKYFAIGMSIVFTGVLAFVSGAYAVYKIFGSLTSAIFIGLLWGLVIANIDRIMVISISKNRHWSIQILQALPRLSFAAIIGVIVSQPIEVHLFEPILKKEARIRDVKENEPFLGKIEKQFGLKSLQKQYDELNIEYKSNETKIVNLKTDISKLKAENYNYAIKKSNLDRNDENYTNKIDRYNGLIKTNKDNLNLIISEAKQIKTENREVKKKRDVAYDVLKREEEKMRVEKENFKSSDKNEEHFIKLLQALHRRREKDEDHSIVWMSWFILIFFTLIEITPVLAKVLASRGSYDFYLEDLTNQERAIVELNQLKRKEAMSYYYKPIGISHENENLKNQSYEDEEE
jgi:hypothetical protein